MLPNEHTEFLTKLFAPFKDPPSIVFLDEETISIQRSPFCIIKDGASYTLTANADDDYVDLFHSSDFGKVAEKAVGEYASWLARNIADDISYSANYEDFKEEEAALQRAFCEGADYYKTTPPENRTITSNPYPFNIVHYDKWNQGYLQADSETKTI